MIIYKANIQANIKGKYTLINDNLLHSNLHDSCFFIYDVEIIIDAAYNTTSDHIIDIYFIATGFNQEDSIKNHYYYNDKHLKNIIETTLDKYYDEYIKSIDICSLDEISITDFIDFYELKMDRHESVRLSDKLYHLISILRHRIDSYYNNATHIINMYEETFEIFDRDHQDRSKISYIQKEILKDEIERINLNNNCLYKSIPYIYFIVGYDYRIALAIAKILIQNLYQNNKCNSQLLYTGMTNILSDVNPLKLQKMVYAGINTFYNSNKILVNNQSKYSNISLFDADEDITFDDVITASKTGVSFVFFKSITEYNIFIKRYYLSSNRGKPFYPIISSNKEFAEENIIKSHIEELAQFNSLPCDEKSITKLYEDYKNYYNKFYSKIDQFSTISKFDIIDSFIENLLFQKLYPEYSAIYNKSIDDVKSEESSKIKTEIDFLIGLNDAKKQISDIISVGNFNQFLTMNKLKGNTDISSMHFVFYGNPGTGKTTVAEIYSRMLAKANIRSDKIKIVGRADLVGKYVGWTASMIKDCFRNIQGGILFIDEAYSLSEDTHNGFGGEAINTLVECMDLFKHNTTVILAGYSDRMKEFINTNPGLKSRISFYINFPDYTVDELTDIAKLIIKDKFDFKVTPGAISKIKQICQTEMLKKNFGNGRFIRNLIDKAYIKHASRHSDKLPDITNINTKSIMTFTAEDFTELNLNDINYDPPRSGF